MCPDCLSHVAAATGSATRRRSAIRFHAHGQDATDGRQVAVGLIGPLIECSLYGCEVALAAWQPVNDTLADQRGNHV